MLGTSLGTAGATDAPLTFLWQGLLTYKALQRFQCTK